MKYILSVVLNVENDQQADAVLDACVAQINPENLTHAHIEAVENEETGRPSLRIVSRVDPEEEMGLDDNGKLVTAAQYQAQQSGEIEHPTVAEVNRAIRAAHGQEKLTAGRGYYYFRNLNGNGSMSPMICINRCSAVPLSRWLRELDAARMADSRG